MHLAIVKTNRYPKRHIALTCTRKEQKGIEGVIKTEILEKKTVPVVEVKGVGPEAQVTFRLNLMYLDYVILAFPMADLSPKLSAKMRKVEEKRIKGMRVPPCVVPGMKKSMRRRLAGYQKIGIMQIVNEEIDLLNDDMGLGKTIQVLSAVRKMKAFPCLVVCPNSALDEWVTQITEHFRDITVAVASGSQFEREQAVWQDADITLINYEGIRAKAIHAGEGEKSEIIGYDYSTPALFEKEFKFGILDEHHRVKTPWAQATVGFFQLVAERWFYLSGTPILNRPEEIWSVLHKSYPKRYPSFVRFRKSLCIMGKGINGSPVVIGYKPKALQKLRNFLHRISLRRRKEQVSDELPEVISSVKTVPLSAEQRKLYDKINTELKLQLEDGTIKNIFGALPKMTRLKQAAFSPELYGGSKKSAKVDEVKDIVAKLVENGEKAIIFSQWSRATRILKRELAQYNPAYVDGSVPRKQGKKLPRKEQAKKFMEDPSCKIFIGTIGANREAINLGVASYVIFTDLDWSPLGMDQALSRSAAGGLRGLNLRKGLKVNVIEIRAENTIEQWISGVLKKKRNLAGRTVDRDGGKKHELVTMKDIRSLLDAKPIRVDKRKRVRHSDRHGKTADRGGHGRTRDRPQRHREGRSDRVRKTTARSR